MDFKTLSEIINISKIKNINEDSFFDYFRVTNYNDDVTLKDKKSILFFPISILDDDLKDGWYIKKWDLRPVINDIVKNNPNYTYVIEEQMIKDMPEGSKYIVVDNIMESINKIFNKKLSEYKGKTICVTGSVGKTTTVGFIKQALGDEAIRIYSKRITPLVLQNFVINYLNNNYKYFVMEASLWYKEHIEYYSKLLKPDMAVLLDVLSEHIGIGEIKDISDITKFKSLLLECANNAIINMMDDELNKLSIKDNYIYYNDEMVAPTTVEKVIKVDEYNKKIEPYIKTKLSLLEETIAYEVAKHYGINEEVILDRLKNASTVENRLQKEEVYDHQVIFDGDVSGVARFNKFADHYYDKSCLVICDLTQNGEEDEPYEKLNNIIDKFNYVFVNRNLSKYFDDNRVIYFDDLDFINDLPKDMMIFMHYGSYYRKYENFDEKKLGSR